MTVRKFDDFKYGFSENNVEKLKTVGMTPTDIRSIINAGRSRGISDDNIWRAINDQYKVRAEQYNAQQEENRDKINTGSAVLALETLPFVGTWADEAIANLISKERGVKDFLGSLSEEEKAYMRENPDYAVARIKERPEADVKKIQAELEEARDYTKKKFEENAKKGNWVERNIAYYTPEAARILNEGIAATATGGLTLMPGVSGLQGAIEGAGIGDDLGSRVGNAIVSGTISAAIPTVLNKVSPTKGVQEQTIKTLAKSKDPLKKYTAEAIKAGTTPEVVISRKVSKGMRPQLWSDIGRYSIGENVFRKNLQEKASDIVSTPYEQYVKKQIAKYLPEYADSFSEEYTKQVAKKIGKKTLVEADKRAIVTDTVNKITKKASEETKDIMRKVMNMSRANKKVATGITDTALYRPINTNSGSLYSFYRRLSAPLRNLSNLGTYRTITTNALAPEFVRGGLDAALENWQKNTVN